MHRRTKPPTWHVYGTPTEYTVSNQPRQCNFQVKLITAIATGYVIINSAEQTLTHSLLSHLPSVASLQ